MVENATNYNFLLQSVIVWEMLLSLKVKESSSVKVHFCHLLLCFTHLSIEKIMGGSGVI